MNICEFCVSLCLNDADSFYKHKFKGRKESGCDSPSLFVWHVMCDKNIGEIKLHMTDVDFIRLSALVFATKLIGTAVDPVSEGMEMAERLFNKLKEKEE